jgi:cyclopropane fatty-acyl-phospholipid synthase-like methyltransferase
MIDQNRQQSFADRYESGEIPWDDRLPPPELMELVDMLVPSKALDLGSGYGRTSIYLAKHGWYVDGVEFVEIAVKEARQRALEASVEHLAHFHIADVADLGFLQGPYDLAVDIGCMHTLEMPALADYRDELKRLLRDEAIYLLFAHLRDPADVSDEADRWIEEDALRELFADGFSLEKAVHGVTQVADNPPWPSAWFYFRRQ